MKKVLLLLLLFTIVVPIPVNAGIFRKGPAFPLWRDRPGYTPSDNPTQPSIPLPPPIVDPTLAPVPQPEQVQPTQPTLEEIKALNTLLSSNETPTSTKYPPWLPVATGAGGGLAALLIALRRALTSI